MHETRWRPLPHVIGRQQLLAVAGLAAVHLPLQRAIAADSKPRTALAVDQWPAIPVWPTWGGGRVVPMSFDPSLADPFLLLAHHKHSFSPGDPLRGPFKAVGGALGLPYVGDEGFAMHPHRGIDILTYVLDGSDGFRHRDSLGRSCVYRGGAAQFMRSGRGAMREEYWETRSDRTTRIELFQLWVNLPSRQKTDPAAIRYVGDAWGAPYDEEVQLDSRGRATRVRHALDDALLARAGQGGGSDGGAGTLARRPPVSVVHATLQPRAAWRHAVPAEHTALLYVRRGAALVPAAEGSGNGPSTRVPAGSSALFERDGDAVAMRNPADDEPCDVLLLSGAPLREPVALGGPIVMNTRDELRQAYRELQAGTFLDG
jgi:redox-sensitive bicupin YhaK (pirin superfamily)